MYTVYMVLAKTYVCFQATTIIHINTDIHTILVSIICLVCQLQHRLCLPYKLSKVLHYVMPLAWCKAT
jgi:hypothetical protein